MQQAFALELKSLGETGEFEGTAAVYGNVDRGGDRMLAGSFTRTLLGSKQRSLLWEHRNVIGTVELQDTATALLARGKLTMEVQQAKEAYALLKAGAVKGMSFGFETIKADYRHGVREVAEVRLWEVSLTWAPMNELATITAVKSAAGLARFGDAIDEFRKEIKTWTPQF